MSKDSRDVYFNDFIASFQNILCASAVADLNL